MLPPVVVDLGPEVARAQMEIVLSACNHAISRGACVPESAAGDVPPRALALARAADRSARVVRIELRLPGDERASIVRELRFARHDPVSERWRSVGLAIATLVGEGEQRAREQEDVAAPRATGDVEAAPAAAPPEAVPGEAVPSEAAPPEAAPGTEKSAASAPAAEASSPRADEPREPEPEPEAPAALAREAREPELVFEPAEPEPPLDWSHRPLFIGFGALVGSGFDAGTLRAGGVLRGAWHLESGLAFGVSAAYALGTSDDPFSVSWLTIDASVGYRYALSERASVGGWLFGGVQRARYETPAGEVSRIETSLSPRFGASGDIWWRAAPMFGLWAALEASTSGRETRLFTAPDQEPARSFPLAAAFTAGFAFWLR